jgi:Skp family chaperone for outer membrane proteins
MSIKKIFDESQRYVKYKEDMTEQQQKIFAEIEKAKAEYDAGVAGLKTIKVGSDEYMERMKELVAKKANLNAQQEYYSTQMSMKERAWILSLYKEIVGIATNIAREKGLDLVLENSEIELETIPDEMLVMNMLLRTTVHAEGCIDITQEVISRLDNK